MAVGNSVNDEIREQHQQMKNKSFKEKLSYFLDYYTMHVLVTIILVFISGNLIYTLATRKDSAIDVAFLNTYLKDEVNTEQLGLDFLTHVGIDTEEYQATFGSGMYIDYEGLDELSAANMQKMMALVSAGALDVLISAPDYIDHTYDSTIFADLTEVVPADILAGYEDRLLYRDVEDDGKGEIPIGIDISDSAIFLTDELPAYFCIIANAPHPETAISLLDYLLEDDLTFEPETE